MKSPVRNQGFSLIEMVMVIVVLSVAGVAILGQFGQAASSLITNERLQAAAQLAQGGAEQVLATRRVLGFNDPALALGSSAEPPIGVGGQNYIRTTDITAAPATGCPTGAICKGVVVTVDQGGPALAEVGLVLVDY